MFLQAMCSSFKLFLTVQEVHGHLGIPEHFCMAKTTDLWLKRSPESKVPDSERGIPQNPFVLRGFEGFFREFLVKCLFAWVCLFLIHGYIFLQ